MSNVYAVNKTGLLNMSNVYAVNKTGLLKTVSSWTVYYINNTSAELVTVYDSSNNPYNCFKYLLNNIEYYYVLDGVQTLWTDDLSSIGYHLPTVLPTVTLSDNLGMDNVSVASGSSTGVLHTWGTGSWSGAAMAWDSTKVYSSTTYSPGDGNRYSSCGVFEPVEVTSGGTGYVGAKNISSSSQTFRNFIIATCSDHTATVVTVYNSSNVAYNAFKFTSSGTDYYYVLDGTQTDWTDDLSSIGYHYGYIDIILGLRYDPTNNDWKNVAFDQTPISTENYWWACVLTQADADALQAFGVTYHDASSIWGGQKFTGPIGNVVYDSDYLYEFLALYSDMGETEAAQDIWSVITLDYLVRNNHGLLVIWDKIINSSTSVKTWKCRITKL